MGKPTGFLEYDRETSTAEAPLERIKHFHEFKTPLKLEEQQKQGARCMECGVPFCQYGDMLAGMASGCPLHQSGTGDQRSGLPRKFQTGLSPSFQDPLFSGIYQSCLSGSL